MWKKFKTKAGQKTSSPLKINRYYAIRKNCGLHNHASTAESDCCSYFQLLERAGHLKILKSQPNVYLTKAKIRVIPDWLILYADGREVYADYKGFETASWGRNRKLWKFYGEKPLEVWKKKGNVFFISETIQPRSE